MDDDFCWEEVVQEREVPDFGRGSTLPMMLFKLSLFIR
jgi:hypothetical protein